MRPKPLSLQALATALLLLALAVPVGSGPGSQNAADSQPDDGALELRCVRALYALSLHSEWPRYRFRDARSPLVVGILGNAPLARTAREYLTERRARRRPVQVASFRDGRGLGNCHLLFVGRCGSEDYQRAEAFAHGRQVLLVAERDPVVRPRPAAALFELRGQLAVEIDRERCERAGVKLSPELLALSRSPEAGEER